MPEEKMSVDGSVDGSFDSSEDDSVDGSVDGSSDSSVDDSEDGSEDDEYVVGRLRLVETRGETSFEWEVPDFFSLSDEIKNFYRSPDIGFERSRWHLEMYFGDVPNRKTQSSLEGWVSIYVFAEDPLDPPKTIRLTLGIKGSDGLEKVTGLKHEFARQTTGPGLIKFISRSELRARKDTLLPDNQLTVICQLRSDSHVKKEELQNEVTSLREQVKALEKRIANCELEKESYKKQSSEKSFMAEKYKGMLEEQSHTVSRLRRVICSAGLIILFAFPLMILVGKNVVHHLLQ